MRGRPPKHYHPLLEKENELNTADHILVSYDVTALFTNVSAHETITILVEKAFSDNWFNDTYDASRCKIVNIDNIFSGGSSF